MEPDPSTRQAGALSGPCSRWPAEHGETIRQIIERAGNKWAVLVVSSLHGGPLRYTDLLHSIPGLSQRMLTHTLHQLRRDGLITRTAYPEMPPRVEYALTDLGTTLLIAITTLIDWAGTHHDEIQDNRTRFDKAGATT